MELEGTIAKVFGVRSGTTERGNWMSQDYLLEYPKFDNTAKMLFTVSGEDKIKRFAIKEGQKVNVSFNVEAHEYNDRWFNSVRAFDVRQRVENAPAPEAGAQNDPFPPTEGDDNLPY